MKWNKICTFVAIITGMMFLTGCASRTYDSSSSEKENGPDNTQQIENNREIEENLHEKAEAAELLQDMESETEATDEEDESESGVDSYSYLPAKAPNLPVRGTEIFDFIPDGWILIDSVELDFNEDGKTDYVGVLEKDWRENEEDEHWYPRILFAVRSTLTEEFQLDFQDVNLIRTRDEGGVYGDPYEPLTADGVSFTTHTYGGSAWRWSEDYTYTYKKGTWYLTASEDTYGYGWFVTSYRMDDWEKGIGIRKEWNDDFTYMDEHWEDEVECDISYEVTLDEPPTLYQASMRWWLAPDRVTDWSVKSIEIAEGILITEDQVVLPDTRTWCDYCDENCMLYTFSIPGENEEWQYFLAMYRWGEQSVSVLTESDAPLHDLQFYKGKIYYSSEIVEEIAYKRITDGAESVVRKEDTIGVQLNRMDEDGGNHEIVYEYRCPEAEEEIMESWPPYMALIYEIGGDEIWLEVYYGNGAHPYYRMNTDGSNLRAIGQVPKDWIDAYTSIIEYKDGIRNYSIKLIDINFDGIPEMFFGMYENGGKTKSILEGYTFQDGKVSQISFLGEKTYPYELELWCNRETDELLWLSSEMFAWQNIDSYRCILLDIQEFPKVRQSTFFAYTITFNDEGIPEIYKDANGNLISKDEFHTQEEALLASYEQIEVKELNGASEDFVLSDGTQKKFDRNSFFSFANDYMEME